MRISIKSGIWSLAGFLAGSAVLVGVAHLPAVHDRLTVASIQSWVEGLGFWGPLGLVAVSAVLPFLFLPRWPVAVVAGALYGILLGTAIGTLAGTLGALFHYVLSKRLAHRAGRQILQRFNLPEQMSDRRAVLLVFTLRVFPLSNYGLTNLLAGALGLRMGPFVAATFLGMIPSTLMYATTGKLLQRPSAGYYALAILLVVLLTGGTWLLGRRFLKGGSAEVEIDIDTTGGA